jgi:hypothetical protein
MTDRVTIATVAERPELTDPAWERTRDTLPEYNNHGDVLGRYWDRLTEERPEFQFHLLGDSAEILARVRSIPVRWDGRIEDLPAGIDGAIARGFDDGAATALCALVIMVPRDVQSRGLSTKALQAMCELARHHCLGSLIAPVRPSWKERYPLIPIERYASWRRADGLPFDPWMRGSRAARRGRPEARAALPADHGDRRRVGGMDGDELPADRRILVPGRIGDRRDRPRVRPWPLLGAERVDAARGLIAGLD